MKTYLLFRYNDDYGEDYYIKSFKTKELAEKMIDLYAEHTYRIKEEFYIEEEEIIENDENELFDVKTLEYTQYNGEEFRRGSINTLQHQNGPWRKFLEGDFTINDGYHPTYELEDSGKPRSERRKKINLNIYRPTIIGNRDIKKEWERLYEFVCKLDKKGKSQDEINESLKKRIQ